MPLFEDLVRRALSARTRAGNRTRDSQRVRGLAEILRDAEAGTVSIRRCAWCERFNVGGEWLHLDAIGTGERTISAHLLERASHGICPDCFERELEQTDAGRAYLARRKQSAGSGGRRSRI
jgi:hypothetical protein